MLFSKMTRAMALVALIATMVAVPSQKEEAPQRAKTVQSGFSKYWNVTLTSLCGGWIAYYLITPSNRYGSVRTGQETYYSRPVEILRTATIGGSMVLGGYVGCKRYERANKPHKTERERQREIRYR